MFDYPHFDFNWEEIYRAWREVCAEEGINPSVSQVLEYDIDSSIGELDLYSDYEWLPIGSVPSQLGPKRASVKGYSYFTSRTNPASQVTATLLMNSLDDDEALACVWIMACTLQLEKDFPSYWRGMHNTSFLSDLYIFCRNKMGDKLDWEWGSNSKRIFPQKYFSKALLDTTDFLTMPQLVRFAALNARYYLDEWLIVRYTVDRLSVKEYRDKRMREALSRMRSFSDVAFPEDNGREKAQVEERGGKQETGRRQEPHQRKKPRLLISENESGELHEGRRRQSLSSAVERNATARRLCLEHYGPTCVVCGMNFEKVFGEEFAGIIDVHHLNPISQKGGDHLVDPIEDMVPLCPNCHRMIHRKKDGVYSPDELRHLIEREKEE